MPEQDDGGFVAVDGGGLEQRFIVIAGGGEAAVLRFHRAAAEGAAVGKEGQVFSRAAGGADPKGHGRTSPVQRMVAGGEAGETLAGGHVLTCGRRDTGERKHARKSSDQRFHWGLLVGGFAFINSPPCCLRHCQCWAMLVERR